MKTVLIACGTGGATSTIATQKVKDLCEKNGIPIKMLQCGYREIFSYLNEVDLIVTTQKVDTDLGKPVIFAFGYITGVGEDALDEQILKALRD